MCYRGHTPVLFTDSMSTKILIANIVRQARMKHIEVNFHFIRDLVLERKLHIRFTHSQVVDALTKPYVNLGLA